MCEWLHDSKIEVISCLQRRGQKYCMIFCELTQFLNFLITLLSLSLNVTRSVKIVDFVDIDNRR